MNKNKLFKQKTKVTYHMYNLYIYFPSFSFDKLVNIISQVFKYLNKSLFMWKTI